MDLTFPIFETLIFSLFDVLQYYLVTNKLNNGSIKFSPKHIKGIVLASLCAGISAYFIEGMYSYFASMCIFIALCWWIYRRTGLLLLYLHIIGISLVLTSQLLVIFLVYVLIGKLEYSSDIGFLAQMMGLTISFMIAKFLPVHLLYRYIETKNDLFRVISLNLFIVLSFCIVYWYMHFKGVLENLIWFLVIVTLILLINLLFLRDGLKNHVIEEQNRAYELYLPIVNELMDEIRIKQHDFDNHMTALKAVLEQQKEAGKTIERVGDCIHEIEQSFRNVDLLKMKNRIVAGFLYSKMKLSVEENIALDICIDDYMLETTLKDYELLDILSILTDNAFETCIPDNRVMIRFYKEKGRSVIEVSNRHPYISSALINDFFAKGFSSKSSEKRGVGLYKLKKIVSGHKGDIEVSNVCHGENFVVFKIKLP